MSTVNTLPVLILCGGLGTRMRSAYPDIPKSMIPVNDEPFIAHQLRFLAKGSVKDVVLCVGYGSQCLVDYIGSGEAFGINVTYSFDGKNLLGTGGAIRQASLKLNCPFAVLYGDSYLDTNITAIFAAYKKSGHLALMTVFKNNNQWVPSNLICEDGLVIVYNKAEPKKDMQYLDYGLSIYSPEIFAKYPAHKAFDLSEVICDLIKDRQLAAYEVKERFYEVGSPAGLNDLAAHLTAK